MPKLKCIFGNIIKYLDVEPTLGGRWLLKFGYFKPLVDEVKAMQGAKFDPDTKTWTIDACMRNTFAFSVLENSDRYRRFKAPLAHTIFPKGHMYERFWDHQCKIYDAITQKRRTIIAAVPRSGKSLPTLSAYMDSDCTICWWVTTKIAKLGVERELNKWFPNTVGKRVVFMSYEGFTDTMDLCRDNVALNPPQFVVFDECHKLKTPNTQRTIAAMLLSETTETKYKDLEYVIGLSGTPAPKDPCDWWTQAEVVRSGYIREGNMKKFKSRYGKWKPYEEGTPVWEAFLGWDTEEISKLASRLKGLVYIFLQEDCFDLPPLRYEEINLCPSQELLRVADMIAKTEDNPLVARCKLRQLSDGFQYSTVYNEDTNSSARSAEFVGSPKIERLKNDLEEYSDIGRICVYAGFQAAVDFIREICLSMGWCVLQIDGRGVVYYSLSSERESASNEISSSTDREQIFMALGEMDRSTDTHKVDKLAVVAHPLSGGAGNEFSSSPVSIYYSNPDSGEARMQSEKRGHSNNMDKSVGHTIIDYILLPTDKLVLDRLKEKKDLQAISMGELQRAIESCEITNPQSNVGDYLL